MIFNIQKCSIHDGSGLRTLVFFKGCPLHCVWCANPESQNYEKEIMESPAKCVGCGLCKTVCPKGAISEDGTIDRNLCDNCMKCVDVCYAESRRPAGKDYTIDDLYKEIEKDKPFYKLYGGGVTFSGGEPLTHGDYLEKIAKKCKANGVSVAVESCGFADYDSFAETLQYIDFMFMDVKIFDTDKHKEYTGQGNELILDNIRKISEAGIPITIRTPIIPGITDSNDNIRKIAEFVGSLPTVKEYELLPYHNFGESKYKALGRDYMLKGMEPPEDEAVRSLVREANNVLVKYGKECFWTKNNTREVVR